MLQKKRKNYNDKLREHISENLTWTDTFFEANPTGKNLLTAIDSIAKQTITHVDTTAHKVELSRESKELLEMREAETDPDIRHYISRDFQKSIRNDRRQANVDAVSKNLDTATRWKGIRNMKKDYQPIPTNLWTEKDHVREKVTYKNKAEAAATFLEEHIWNNKKPDGADQEIRRPKTINWDLDIKKDEFSYEELRVVIKKLRKKKAAGPDKTLMEYFKELDEDN